jgi:hypothetical protein
MPVVAIRMASYRVRISVITAAGLGPVPAGMMTGLPVVILPVAIPCVFSHPFAVPVTVAAPVTVMVASGTRLALLAIPGGSFIAAPMSFPIRQGGRYHERRQRDCQ